MDILLALRREFGDQMRAVGWVFPHRHMHKRTQKDACKDARAAAREAPTCALAFYLVGLGLHLKFACHVILHPM